MGILFSCPFAPSNELDFGFEPVTVKSISFGDDQVKTQLRSVSFNAPYSDPTILHLSLGTGNMVIEGSISFNHIESDTVVSINSTPSHNKMNSNVTKSDHQELDCSSPKHEAAVKLQKVYRSFRTRRKLADCAVFVEQSWWKLLDFAQLKRSSVSFFEIEKQETPISRWSRARTRAAKVGKGLLKNHKAQKLALQHWLEAIDPRHRYGHNLHFYYVKWLHCQSREPFFYWLDIGEGKEVNLVEKCSRSKLQQQCIKYLGPMERETYEVIVEDGKFVNKQTGELLCTIEELADIKWIFVLSKSKKLYVGKKKKGSFQHSSFLAGGATSAAGRLVVENGILKAVWPHSGHYRPTEENFKDLISFFAENNVDLTDVKMNPVDEEEGLLKDERNISHFRNNSSEDYSTQDLNELETEDTNVRDLIKEETLEAPKSMNLQSLGREQKQECGTEEEYTIRKATLFEDKIPEESIIQRINSHKGMKSYQLGKQLSCKWTTGAGPRIGCVRDYPSELQFRALDQVNLSPRSSRQPVNCNL